MRIGKHEIPTDGLIYQSMVGGVWRTWDGWVYKHDRAPGRTTNEIRFLKLMEGSGYTAEKIERMDDRTFRMEDLGCGERVSLPADFLAHGPLVLETLRERGLRHGDLTHFNILVHGNKPYIMDFADTRMAADPCPPKRPQSDTDLLTEALEFLAKRRCAPRDYFPRSSARWRLLGRTIPFRGKVVLDIACGPGDMVQRAVHAGAARIDAVDYNPKWLSRITDWAADAGIGNITTTHDNINFIDRILLADHYDVGLCLSVFAYLTDPAKLFAWLRDRCDVVVIEPQYAGDGQGPAWCNGPETFREFALRTFANVELIGETHVVCFDTYRGLWKCWGKR